MAADDAVKFDKASGILCERAARVVPAG